MSAIADKTKIHGDILRVFEVGQVKYGSRKKVTNRDMKAFAKRVAARLKKHYGDRVAPDSAELMDYVRGDASCQSASTPHSS